jgi:hypothetical protein
MILVTNGTLGPGPKFAHIQQRDYPVPTPRVGASDRGTALCGVVMQRQNFTWARLPFTGEADALKEWTICTLCLLLAL